MDVDVDRHGNSGSFKVDLLNWQCDSDDDDDDVIIYFSSLNKRIDQTLTCLGVLTEGDRWMLNALTSHDLTLVMSHHFSVS